MDEIFKFLGNLVYAVVAVVVVAVFVGVVVNTGLAPEPGDPFYIAWLDVTQYGWQALVWIVPGIGAASYLILKLVEDVSGF